MEGSSVQMKRLGLLLIWGEFLLVWSLCDTTIKTAMNINNVQMFCKEAYICYSYSEVLSNLLQKITFRSVNHGFHQIFFHKTLT